MVKVLGNHQYSLVRGIIYTWPQFRLVNNIHGLSWPQFRLVNYLNLPRKFMSFMDLIKSGKASFLTFDSIVWKFEKLLELHTLRALHRVFFWKPAGRSILPARVAQWGVVSVRTFCTIQGTLELDCYSPWVKNSRFGHQVRCGSLGSSMGRVQLTC